MVNIAAAYIEEEPETETIEDIIAKCFPEDKSYNIELDKLLPLRSPIFTDGDDLSELSSSIARMGITEPLLVRSAGNGEYEILSGNRRRSWWLFRLMLFWSISAGKLRRKFRRSFQRR